MFHRSPSDKLAFLKTVKSEILILIGTAFSSFLIEEEDKELIEKFKKDILYQIIDKILSPLDKSQGDLSFPIHLLSKLNKNKPNYEIKELGKILQI